MRITVTRGRHIVMRVNTFKERFERRNSRNRNLDSETKLIALKVSASVVGIGCTSLDGKFHFSCSGTMIKCSQLNPTTYLTTILTSAAVFGSSCDKNFKAEVYLWNGRILKVQSFDYDHHYNVATLKVESDVPMPTANLRNVDVSYSIASESFEIRRHSQAFSLSPHGKVIAVGRYFCEPFDLMAAPGQYSARRCNLDCRQLLMATCNISKCGIGGPLINIHGEVIGINFYDERYTPFLPMNIALKCVENFEKYGKFPRPSFGIEGANLCAATSLAKLEKIIQKFPDISKSVLVEGVVPASPADHAGICRGDLIVQCGGKIIKSLLEFDTMLLDKVGESVEVHVVRIKESTSLQMTVTVDDISPDKFYSWPIPKERWEHKMTTTFHDMILLDS